MNTEKQNLKEDIASTYFNKISPKIKEIDITLKENKIISIKKTANLLDLKEDEILKIMKTLKISKINKKNFIQIMLNADSFICEIFRRELECGSPNFYSPKDISYIYNIDEYKVFKAFEFLELEFITTNQIPTILIQIK